MDLQGLSGWWACGGRAAGSHAGYAGSGLPDPANGKAALPDGVGTPDDILKSVARGIDMFDCVMPTRAGRHGLAFTRFGKVNLRNARHAEDHRPLDPQSDCPASRDYSRAYLHHLVKSGEALGAMLLTWNNLAYYQYLMKGIRAAIADGNFSDFTAETTEGWARGDMPAL
nr:tRNA-guanine transglycosylase [Brucella abortus]